MYSSTIIDSLVSDCDSQVNSGIAYFYFDYTNNSISQDHSNLIRSVIEQLSSQSGEVPAALKLLYERCRRGTVQPSTTDLVDALRSILRSFSRCYLVIDAVDESKEKQKFLELLNTIAKWRLPQIHILVTSRTDIDTEIRVRDWNCVTVMLEDHYVDADVRTHVMATLRDDAVLSQWDANHRGLIAASLVNGAHGKLVPPVPIHLTAGGYSYLLC
jgi:hypothetical protein